MALPWRVARRRRCVSASLLTQSQSSLRNKLAELLMRAGAADRRSRKLAGSRFCGPSECDCRAKGARSSPAERAERSVPLCRDRSRPWPSLSRTT
eukprot:2775701-Prymnesium_polylepis.1